MVSPCARAASIRDCTSDALVSTVASRGPATFAADAIFADFVLATAVFVGFVGACFVFFGIAFFFVSFFFMPVDVAPCVAPSAVGFGAVLPAAAFFRTAAFFAGVDEGDGFFTVGMTRTLAEDRVC
jgi:hypothetical protein